MTKKQRIAFWRRVSQCFDRHEREMIEQSKKMKSRIDIIGQNGNTGEHYAEVEKEQINSRGNWYGLAEDWDTSDEWDESDEIEASKKNELSDYEKKYGHDGTEANNMALFEGLRHQVKPANKTKGRELSDYEKKYGQDGTVANNMAMESILLHRYLGANYTGRNKEPDATSMDDDLPSAAEDNARQRGNFEI